MTEKSTHFNQKRRVVSVCLLSLTFLFGPCLSSAKVTSSRPLPGPYDESTTVDFPVRGVVKDKTGMTLPGVSVLIKGTTTGTVTGNDGRYTIDVSGDDQILIFSFIGYVRQEVPVKGRSTIDVVLEGDVTSLDEVVIIGYGTQKKSDLTGSVGSVDKSQLEQRPATSLNQALSGRIAGVQVNTNSGRPGGRANVRIRGFSSITNTNNPLYIVDGVALPLTTMYTDNQFIAQQPIDYINPNDIVSVEILKDASSTAIYGARATNGVILITTKRGKTGSPSRVTYDVNFSTNVIGPNCKPEVLTGKEFLDVQYKAWQNGVKYDSASWVSPTSPWPAREPRRTDPRLFDSNGEPLYETNWLDETTNKSNLSQNHQLNISGGGETNAYSIGLGFRDDEGLLMNTDLKRYSVRFSYDDQVKKWLKIGGTLSYNRQRENMIDNTSNVTRYIVEGIPYMPVKYPDGTYSRPIDDPNLENVLNPVQYLMEQKCVVNTQTIIGSFYSNINVTKDLEMRTVLGANVVDQNVNQFIAAALRSGKALGRVYNSEDAFWSLENYFTYNKRIGSDHSINAVLGLSVQESKNFNSATQSVNFASDYFEYNFLQAGSEGLVAASGASRFAFSSYFGRVNYTLKDKYLLTITGRVDGSSKFGHNNRYAFFPSTALAWKISEEDFMANATMVSNLKLRASHGLTGNSEISPYITTPQVFSGTRAIYNNVAFVGTGPSLRGPNPDLKWEKTAQSDIGLELGLFQNRITLEADLYYRKTENMLLSAPLPRSSGYQSVTMNVGSMENKGLELALTTVNVQTEKLTWSSRFNISMNRNKVLSLATPADIITGPNLTASTIVIREGEPLGSFRGLVRVGTWSTAEAAQARVYRLYPGDSKHLDVNADGFINDADRLIIGNGSPDAWGAFSNTVRYKNLDFTVELQYSYGNDILDLTSHSGEDRVSIANSYRTVLNAWTPESQNTDIQEYRYPVAGVITTVDSHWVKDGSFVRGKNLLLGYTFPDQVLNKLALSRLRVYTSVQNFFLLVDKEVQGDPEIQPLRGADADNNFSQGIKWYDYPKSTTFMLGLQVGF